MTALDYLYRILRPILWRLPPEQVHLWSLKALKYMCAVSSPLDVHTSGNSTVRYWGRCFPNRLGLAAGADKNGEYVLPLFRLGFGFIEVGTVTPRPQLGQPLPRVFRLPAQRAIINRLGFNNRGVHFLLERLTALPTVPGMVGVNIGKNKDTPLQRSVEDYLYCFKRVYAVADYVTINVSSPNTPNLRDLQDPHYLQTLWLPLLNMRKQLHEKTDRYVPILVKLSPDLSNDARKVTVDYLISHAVDGLIATNTTVSRSGLPASLPQTKEKGGLSGQPLYDRSTQILKQLRAQVGPDLPLVGVGGIASPAQAKAKRAAGADLLQIYTGLIYEGPGLVKRILRTDIS